MSRFRLLGLILAALCWLCYAVSNRDAKASITTIQVAGATGTYPKAVDGSTIVGYSTSGNGNTPTGFMFDGSTTWTTGINYSGASGTYVTGVSGSTLSGYYVDSSSVATGFILNGSAWTLLSDPNQKHGTYAYGISGNKVVGTYEGSTHNHGFTYDVTTQGYTTIDVSFSGGYNTTPTCIDSNNLIGGYYENAGVIHGFTYDGSTWTTVTDPLADYATYVYGVSGNTIVGTYEDSSDAFHSFVCTNGVYTNFDVPGASTTSLTGTDGVSMVGNFYSGGAEYGFVTTPEPASLAIFGLLIPLIAVSRRFNHCLIGPG